VKKINLEALVLTILSPGRVCAEIADSHSLVLPRRVTNASKSRAIESTIDFAWREARSSARLRFQVSSAIEVIETRTVTMMVVIAIATISSIRVKPRFLEDVIWVFMNESSERFTGEPPGYG